MATKSPRTDRRTDALSRDRIVSAAIEILDTEGESALTFRALTTRLSTGVGAIYWHVDNKDELLAAATHDVIAEAVEGLGSDAAPRDAIRAVALRVFDAIDEHPWIGTQLSREPWQPAVLLILEGVGHPLDSLGVPQRAQFDAASALLNFILGLAGQYAAGARLIPSGTDRSQFLGEVADRWSALDPADYPFVRQMATQLPTHDDRDQFLAGIDLILTGITTVE